MVRFGTLLIAASFVGLGSVASAATVGFQPKTFADSDAVTFTYQHKATTGGRVLVKLLVRDGTAATANIVHEDSKWVTFAPGALTDVQFDAVPALGSKATGIKLRVQGMIVRGRDQINTFVASTVITKVCTKAGSGSGTNVLRTCRWKQFRPY
jgi:hypothetical protein